MRRTGSLQRWVCWGAVLTSVVFTSLLLAVRNVSIEADGIPVAHAVSPNALDYYLQAAQLLDAATPAQDSECSTVDYALHLGQTVRLDGPVFAAIRYGLRLPYRQPEARTMAEWWQRVDLRQRMTVLGGVLCSQAGNEARADNHRASSEYALACLGMGVQISSGGDLDALQPAVVLLEQQANDVIAKQLPVLSADELLKTGRELKRISGLRRHYACIIQDEGLNQVSVAADYMRASAWNAATFGYAYYDPDNPSSLGQRAGRAVRIAFADKRLLLSANLRYYETAAELCRQGTLARWGPPPPSARLDGGDIREQLLNGWADYSAATNEYRILQCAVAVYAYKRRNGILPGDLEDLVPRYLESVPNDAADLDSPIVYQRSSDGAGFSLHVKSGRAERRFPYLPDNPGAQWGPASHPTPRASRGTR